MNRFKYKDSFKLKVLVIISIAIFVSALIIWFGGSLHSRITTIEKSWIESSKHSIAITSNINKINTNFGYGGFIHNFKYLVLRRDKSLIPVVKSNLEATYNTLAKLALSDLEIEQHQAVKQFKKVVDQYAEKLLLVEEMINQGDENSVIDARVEVDDMPALSALSQLTRHILEDGQEIEHQTSGYLNQTQSFINKGIWFIVLILIITVVLILFLKRLVQTNNRLKNADQYSQDVIEAVPDALFVIAESGEIKHANIQAIKLFGYSHEELMNMTVEGLLPNRFRHHHVGIRDSAFQQSNDRPMENNLELLAQTKNGTEFPVEISLSFSEQSEGKISIVSIRDINERKTAEFELNNKTEMMNMAQEMAHMGSWDWDINNNTLSWSDEIYRIFGLKPQSFEATYEAFLESIHAQDRKLVIDAVNATVYQDAPYCVEHRVIRPDGEQRLVLENGQLYRDEAGEPYAWWAVCTM